MLQIARPLANETIESAAIALLEAESVNDITGILLDTCLARAEASRGAMLLGAGRSMTLARCHGGLSIAAACQAEFLSRVRQASTEGAVIALFGVDSAFEGVATPVTGLVLPLRQRGETVGTLYIEYDGGSPGLT